MYRQQSLLTTLLFLSFVTSNHKFQFVFLTHNYSTLSTIYYVPPNILMYNVPSTVYFDYVPCTMFNYYLRYITATQKKKILCIGPDLHIFRISGSLNLNPGSVWAHKVRVKVIWRSNREKTVKKSENILRSVFYYYKLPWIFFRFYVPFFASEKSLNFWNIRKFLEIFYRKSQKFQRFF